MHYQPLPYNVQEYPKENDLCEVCVHALRRAEDMFASAVCEAVNDYTIPQVLSIDIRHQEAPKEDLWPQRFPGKYTWQHILRCYNHTRTEYLTNMAITVLYRKTAHSEKCKYAYIVTEVTRKRSAPQMHHNINREITRRLALESRRFTGPGTTSIERKESPQAIEYLINTMVGNARVLPVQPGYKRIKGYIHNYMDESPMEGETALDDYVPVASPVIPDPALFQSPRDEPSTEEIVYRGPRKVLTRRETH